MASYQCSPATSTGKMSLLIFPPGHCQGGESNPANEVKRENCGRENGLWSKSVYPTTLPDAVHLFVLFSLCVYYFLPPVFVRCHLLCYQFEFIHQT